MKNKYFQKKLFSLPKNDRNISFRKKFQKFAKFLFIIFDLLPRIGYSERRHTDLLENKSNLKICRSGKKTLTPIFDFSKVFDVFRR